MLLRPTLRKATELGFALTAVATLFLAGCGGGGSSTATNNTPATSLMSGVAAVGAPIVSGAIKVSCASGSTLNTSTSTTGDWQVTLSGQTLPCAVQVSGGTINGVANPTPYHAIATTAGTVNVTPLTDLIVANLAGSSTPSAWFAGLNSTPAPLATITQTNVDSALTKLRAAFPTLTPLASINPITTSFTAISGNASDDMLASLKTAMANTAVTHAALLSNAAVPAFNPPVSGFDTALTAAYAVTSSGGSGGGTTPTITSFTPSIGAANTSMTITGTNLNVAIGVLFTGPAPLSDSVGSVIDAKTGNSITTTVPASLAAGDYIISVVYSTNSEVVATNTFTVTQVGGVTPAVPTGVTATPQSATGINIGWSPVSGATGYNVYRSLTTGVEITAANMVTTAPAEAVGFGDRGLIASTTYYYKVTAINATGESVGSAEVSATTSSGVVTGLPTGFVVRTNPAGANINAPSHLVWTGSQFIGLEQSTDYYNANAKFFTWTSADGIGWTRNTTNMQSTFPSMTAANGLAFQLVVKSGANPSVDIYSSADGITWSPSTATYTTGSYSASPVGVKYVNNKYFVSLNEDTCQAITSPDALTWTSVDLKTLPLPTGYYKKANERSCGEPFFMGGQYLIYGGAIEFFVSGATDLLTKGLVYTSADGVSWTANSIDLPAGVNSIAFGGSYLQFGNTIVLASAQTYSVTTIGGVPTGSYTNKQVGSSTDGLNFTFSSSGLANTPVPYPSLQLPGGMLGSVKSPYVIGTPTTWSYYQTSDGITYTPTSDLWVGEIAGFGVAPYAYSPTLRRLVGIKNVYSVTNYQKTGVIIGTYDFP